MNRKKLLLALVVFFTVSGPLYWSLSNGWAIEENLENVQRIKPDLSILLEEDRAILTHEDLEIEKMEHIDTPALSSSLREEEQWKSFNLWLCFNSRDLSVVRIAIEYDGKEKEMPLLNATVDNYLFEFALSADAEYDNRKIELRWHNIINSTSSVCVYAAFLQGSEETSYWIISRLKSENGYWIESEE